VSVAVEVDEPLWLHQFMIGHSLENVKKIIQGLSLKMCFIMLTTVRIEVLYSEIFTINRISLFTIIINAHPVSSIINLGQGCAESIWFSS
jgi:hypothetical protein